MNRCVYLSTYYDDDVIFIKRAASSSTRSTAGARAIVYNIIVGTYLILPTRRTHHRQQRDATEDRPAIGFFTFRRRRVLSKQNKLAGCQLYNLNKARIQQLRPLPCRERVE